MIKPSIVIPSMSLPVLKLERAHHQTCSGKDKCSTCPLFNKFCRGCFTNKEEECGPQHTCVTDCNSCHGENTARFIQGVCCKSPLANHAIDRIQTLPHLPYAKVPKLDFPDERIPVLLDRHHGSPSTVNAIGMHRVYSKKGWKSRDMKDYLKLDKRTKLILLTVMRDNHLENFMEKRWYDSVQQVGFDYWQPLMFSMFTNEAQMQRLFSFWRIMKNLSDSHGHMVPFGMVSGHRLIIEGEVQRALKAAPNIFINASHGSEQKEAQFRILGYVRKWAKVYGPSVTWLIQGCTDKSKRVVFRSLLPAGTSCYFFITPKTGARRSGDQYGWHSEKPAPGKK